MELNGGISQEIDVSVVLNLHREGIYIARTLESLDEAVRCARDSGYTVELVIVFDNADGLSREVVRKHDRDLYDSYKIVNVCVGSLGLARNAGIEAAIGRYVCTADGDDLISYNFISESIKLAISEDEDGNGDALYFPEVMLRFDDAYFIYIYRDLNAVTPMGFLGIHPYVSRAFARRDIFSRVRYVDVRLGGGYAYEDWHFNAACVAAGIDVRIVPGICLFYRQRAGSLFEQANSSSVRQIPPCALFEPGTFLRVCSPFFDGVAHSSRVKVEEELPSRSMFKNDHWASIFRRASCIEDKIAGERYFECPMSSNVDGRPLAGELYFRICEIIEGKKFQEIFLFPFVGLGDAERYMIALMEAFYKIAPELNVLLILGEEIEEDDCLDLIPPNVVVLDLALLEPEATLRDRLLATLKVVQCHPDARLHFRPSLFANAFLESFAQALSSHELVYYRLFDDQRKRQHREISAGYDSTFDLISKHLCQLNLIISDSEAIGKKDRRKIKLFEEKWQHIYPPAPPDMEHVPANGTASNRIMMVSALEAQGFDLLPAIASALQSASAGASIDVYSIGVHDDVPRRLRENNNNLAYKGGYDGFDKREFHRYEIFLYISGYDGIPSVLLEAMSAGLPVVAPDVGGISELVVDGVSGMLLPRINDDVEMARLYVDAILHLRSDSKLRRRLLDGAQDLIARRYSNEAHLHRVSRVFRIGKGFRIG